MNHCFSIIISFIGGVAGKGQSPNRGQSPHIFFILPAGQSPASHQAAEPQRNAPNLAMSLSAVSCGLAARCEAGLCPAGRKKKRLCGYAPS